MDADATWRFFFASRIKAGEIDFGLLVGVAILSRVHAMGQAVE